MVELLWTHILTHGNRGLTLVLLALFEHLTPVLSAAEGLCEAITGFKDVCAELGPDKTIELIQRATGHFNVLITPALVRAVREEKHVEVGEQLRAVGTLNLGLTLEVEGSERL